MEQFISAGMNRGRVPRAAAQLFWCPFKGIDNIFVSLGVKVSLLIKIPWRPTSPKLIMISLSGWLCVAPLPPALLWMGCRLKAHVVAAESSASQNGNLGCSRAVGQKGKSNIQFWGSSKSAALGTAWLAYGQERLHECLQRSVERAAGRFIRGESGKLLPKLSLALMG